MDDAQVQALMQTWHDALAKQMADMKLRQWCVEQAIKALGGQSFPPPFVAHLPDEALRPAGEVTRIRGVVTLSEQILKFISAPFAEIFKELVPPGPGSPG